MKRHCTEQWLREFGTVLFLCMRGLSVLFMYVLIALYRFRSVNADVGSVALLVGTVGNL
jgi:hypothetical protein